MLYIWIEESSEDSQAYTCLSPEDFESPNFKEENCKVYKFKSLLEAERDTQILVNVLHLAGVPLLYK